MKMPDFEQWAIHTIQRIGLNKTSIKTVAESLEQAFEQGYHLGLNQGWAIEQDKEHVKKDSEAKS